MYIRAKSRPELAGPDRAVHEAGRASRRRPSACLEGVAGPGAGAGEAAHRGPGHGAVPLRGAAGAAPEDLLPKKARPGCGRPSALRRLEACCPSWASAPEASEARLRALAEELGVKLGDLLMPLRVAVTGSKVSPPLFESIRVMGVEERAQARGAGHRDTGTCDRAA